MRVTVQRTDAELARLWPAWGALWEQVPDATPFLSPAWLRPWWDAFGTELPMVATLNQDDRLLGVLPLYRLENKLLPIGVGISDSFDVLIDPSAPSDADALLLAAILQQAKVDRCDLPELPVGSVLRDVPAPTGWTADLWPGPPNPVLTLVPEPAIPKGMRRDLRQARHRAERAGGWRVHRADAASFPATLDQLVRLHRRRWEQCGEPGVLADPRVLAFHRAAGPLLLGAGLLRMEALWLRDVVAAVIYALLSPGRIHFYLTGFDPDCRFESPGTILLGHMIEQAAAEGRREAHFLRGSERYKYAWGGIDRMNAGRSFVRA